MQRDYVLCNITEDALPPCPSAKTAAGPSAPERAAMRAADPPAVQLIAGKVQPDLREYVPPRTAGGKLERSWTAARNF